MSKTTRLVLALILCVSAIYGEQIIEFIKNNVEIVDDTPSVNVVEPSLTYKEVVKDVVSINIESADAKQISDFFSELADVVNDDPGFIRTTGNFREFNMKAGGLNFAGLELKNKYPNLGEEIDAVIISGIGSEDQTLTDSKRSELVKSLDAIAWAVHQ